MYDEYTNNIIKNNLTFHENKILKEFLEVKGSFNIALTMIWVFSLCRGHFFGRNEYF